MMFGIGGFRTKLPHLRRQISLQTQFESATKQQERSKDLYQREMESMGSSIALLLSN